MESTVVIENTEVAEGDVLDLTEQEAKRLTDDIRSSLALAHGLIQSAWEKRAWLSLGYRTWDEYVRGEFQDLVLTPPLERRQSVVASMSESGMSLRAIAAATDLSPATVQRTLKKAESAGETPVRESRVGLDGKTYKTPAAASGGDDLDAALLDLDADSVGVARFETDPTPTTTPEKKGPKNMHPHEDVDEMGDTAKAPTALSDARAAVDSAAATMRTALESAHGQIDPEDVEADMLRALAYSMVVTAGLVDVLVSSKAPATDTDIIRRDLEVAVSTIDKAVDALGGDGDE